MAKASNVQGEDEGPLATLVKDAAAFRGPAPVHLWDPPDCGEIDMRIARDGTWFYNGSPIGRPALVKLFASVLRRDGDRHVLVTPVEKVGITVEDAPFLAVEMQRDREGAIRFRTNVNDWVTVGAEHPMRFSPGAAAALKPYVRVRADLWALVSRAVFYDLVAEGEARDVAGTSMYGIASGASFFPMLETDALEGAPDLA